ncbi:M23 family metallopeptidase [Paenibacillus lactis]|uniref:M23 family metallopeptidase n=1 Tax=Paenibacillus lactis TaxID=228574 RepID=UPI00203ECA54|nr:M23 family metallopeptidase [Paenibacillus lactis]MCM3496828.1 M23 family metallopeptidase [Paenibacillus lactis]
MVDIAQWMLEGRYVELYEQFGQELKMLASEEQFQAMAKEFMEGVSSLKVETDTMLGEDRLIQWVDDSGFRGMEAMVDKEGIIVGFRLSPLERFPETDEMLTQTAFRFPFLGEWLVFWGGQHEMANYHYAEPSQRYAIDVVKTSNGMTYSGDPARNDSYFAFGQPIVAGAKGVVVGAENAVPDNEPVGVMNEVQPAGNYVILDHGNNEYSLYAHLKHGSVGVKVGEEVEAGDEIGLCGNSGNSSEAHLHFQVMDHPDLFREGTASLNVRWIHHVRVSRGVIVTGE